MLSLNWIEMFHGPLHAKMDTPTLKLSSYVMKCWISTTVYIWLEDTMFSLPVDETLHFMSSTENSNNKSQIGSGL